jgi:biopolymer transport protein TolR
MRRSRAKRFVSEINVVPYIDVMLVLLIIFMVTTPLLSEGVKVTLPEAKARTLNEPRTPIIVTVDKKGNYYLNLAEKPNQPLSPIILTNRVRLELQNDDGTRQVLVKGDRQVTYDKVMQAMVILQQAGAKQVGLVTQPPAA